MQWMLMPFRRYADFSGRSRRQEYWAFFFLNMLVMLVFWLLAVAGGGLWTHSDTEWLLIPFFGIFGLYWVAALIPGLAVTIRRLHDTDRSGFNILWALVPLVGAIMLLYFYFSEGTKGPNRFGPDPKGGEAAAPGLA